MEDFLARAFFDLTGFEHAALFPEKAPAWEALGPSLDAYLEAWERWGASAQPPPGVHVLEGPIYIAPGCRIEPGAVQDEIVESGQVLAEATSTQFVVGPREKKGKNVRE